MEIEAIYPNPRLSLGALSHRIYPYLSHEVKMEHVNQVWSADTTDIRSRAGFVYLGAIIDWYSRYVLTWKV
jgi:putative transposase